MAKKMPQSLPSVRCIAIYGLWNTQWWSRGSSTCNICCQVSSVKHSMFVTSPFAFPFGLWSMWCACGMYKYVSIHGLICTYGSQRRMSCVLFCHSLPCFLDSGSLTRPVASKSQWPFCLCHPTTLGLQVCVTMLSTGILAFKSGAWPAFSPGPNS